MTRPALVITCEHGGNHIPAVYRPLFEGQDAALQSHRGFDAGALKMAQTLAEAFGAPLVSATVSRLLVDLNRSTHNRTLHAEAVRRLPATQRQAILTRHFPAHGLLRFGLPGSEAEWQRLAAALANFAP